jgi:phage-related tail protein
MNETEPLAEPWLAERFEEHRGHLRAVAYRMLGSLAEADDAVQNTWLRLSRADAGDVENLAGWLTTVVARECLKMLRAALPVGAAALLRGARAVGTHALTYSRSARSVQPALVNGAAGLAIVPNGQLIGALSFTFKEGKIAEIEGISGPERLRLVDPIAL